MTINIVRVCDDDNKLAQEWVEEIKTNIGEQTTVERIDDPAEEFHKLLRRIPNGDGQHAAPNAEHSMFDDADVLVVDYDLVRIDVGRARHTGEGFARMCRLYSDCSYVIILNQFATTADFDLELVGHPGSFGDLNISSEFAGSLALWGGARNGTFFAPWQWPNIETTLDLREALTTRLREQMDLALLEAIEFPADRVQQLSDKAFAFIMPPASADDVEQEPLKRTLRGFLDATREHKEIARAHASCPLRASRAAAARLSKWYSRQVLEPQDLLVDVPHLLERMPFLMRADVGDVRQADTWNLAIAKGAAALVDEVQPFLFEPAGRWIGRDAFWWPDIVSSPECSALRGKYKAEDYADVVFAEDASAFIPYQDATAFRAGFHNQFDIRYIKRFEGVNYGPSRRFAAV